MSKEAPVVMISSTKEDLGAYRDAARDAANRAGFLLKMMEYSVAEGKNRPYKECMEWVDDCDVLVVIVGHRYGWVPPDQPGAKDRRVKSITWLECLRAKRGKKEILAFAVDEGCEWPAPFKETHRLTEAIEAGKFTPELAAEVNRSAEKLREFKEWLNGLGVRSTFADESGLRADVEAALGEWKKRNRGGAKARAVKRVQRRKQDPAGYLKWLHDETAWIDIRGLQVGSGKANRFPIEELYIPLVTAGGLGAKDKRGEPEHEAGKPVRLEETLGQRRLVIVGDPGSGKTTFLRRIAHECCRKRPEMKLPAGAFPLWIRIAELEQYIAKGKDGPALKESPAWLEQFLAARSQELGWGLDAGFFEGKLREKSTVVLLDGLDEAPSRARRTSIARLFENVTKKYRQCRFVVTTRPGSYTGEATLAGFAQTRIDDLGAEAVEGFLGHWSVHLHPGKPVKAESHKQELLGALRARPEIRRMARNPVMLTALAVVHWNERRFPEQRADLYESILRWLARAREQKPGRVTAERCLDLLGQLALGMQKDPTGRSTTVSKGRAAELIAGRFRDVPEEERLQRALAFLDEEEIDSGIVVSRGSEVAFWHLTFQEYLAARAIAGLGETAQQKLLLSGDKLYRPEWREVMLLLGGVLHVKQGADKVDGLFAAVLDRVGEKASLAKQARCAGLLGAMLRDLDPLGYHAGDGRYGEMLAAALGVFDAKKSAGIDFGIRLEAAEALGQAGDPRVDKDYWVAIPGGKFLMGAQSERPGEPGYDPDANDEREAPPHEVVVGDFRMGRYPVTVEEYRRFVEDDGYGDERWWDAGGFGELSEPDEWADQQEHPNRPVVHVSWYEASAYCAWAGGRLPSEAEWEYAARGRGASRYPWGDTPALDHSHANYRRKVGSPSPVGLFPKGATPEGLCDALGNVLEWCLDWYGPYETGPQGNPTGPQEGSERILRGGSWFSIPQVVRVSDRLYYVPTDPEQLHRVSLRRGIEFRVLSFVLRRGVQGGPFPPLSGAKPRRIFLACQAVLDQGDREVQQD